MLNTKLEVLEQKSKYFKKSIDNFIKCEVIKALQWLVVVQLQIKNPYYLLLSLEYKT